MYKKITTILCFLIFSFQIHAELSDERRNEIAQHHNTTLCARFEEVPLINYLKLGDEPDEEGIHALIITADQLLDTEHQAHIQAYFEHIDPLLFILDICKNDDFVGDEGTFTLRRDQFPKDLTDIFISNTRQDVTDILIMDHDDSCEQMNITFDDHLSKLTIEDVEDEPPHKTEYYTRIVENHAQSVSEEITYLSLGAEPNDTGAHALILNASELLDSNNHLHIKEYAECIEDGFILILDIYRGDNIVSDEGALRLYKSMIPSCITSLFISNLAHDVKTVELIDDEDEERDIHIELDHYLTQQADSITPPTDQKTVAAILAIMAAEEAAEFSPLTSASDQISPPPNSLNASNSNLAEAQDISKPSTSGEEEGPEHFDDLELVKAELNGLINTLQDCRDQIYPLSNALEESSNSTPNQETLTNFANALKKTCQKYSEAFACYTSFIEGMAHFSTNGTESPQHYYQFTRQISEELNDAQQEIASYNQQLLPFVEGDATNLDPHDYIEDELTQKHAPSKKRLKK